ncbi:glucose dehydrogenase [Penicillium chrysogenum]|uniref:Glucose dehydrogenase n=2 Tax=Penicillium chrysogenum TaxID=5076 RepID=A0ABQ8WRD3_PENCH|nr:glucose dehydrogenase [Penicillium chrysogenum]KAJ6156914.1 glucose dehydrogenase [Penicillium chrysogenum]
MGKMVAPDFCVHRVHNPRVQDASILPVGINGYRFGCASLRLRIQSHIQLQFKRLITKLNVVLSNMFH